MFNKYKDFSQESQWSAEVLDSLFSYAGAKTGVSLTTALLSLLIGDNFALLFAIVLLVVMDFVTGVAKALYMENFKSEGLRKGAVKLVVYLLLMVIAHQFSNVSNWLLWFEEAVYCYLAITEYESIAENLRVFGIEWPSIARLYELVQTTKKSQK